MTLLSMGVGCVGLVFTCVVKLQVVGCEVLIWLLVSWRGSLVVDAGY